MHQFVVFDKDGWCDMLNFDFFMINKTKLTILCVYIGKVQIIQFLYNVFSLPICVLTSLFSMQLWNTWCSLCCSCYNGMHDVRGINYFSYALAIHITLIASSSQKVRSFLLLLTTAIFSIKVCKL